LEARGNGLDRSGVHVARLPNGHPPDGESSGQRSEERLGGMIDFLFERMESSGEGIAVVTPESSCTHRDLAARVRAWQDDVEALPAGRVVSIEGDYGPELIAAFLALAASRHVVVPLSPDSQAQHPSFLEIASVEYRIRLGKGANVPVPVEPTGRAADHPLYAELRQRRHPGLILFSSGSTGRPKATLHDLLRLLAKYEKPRQRYRTIVFLLLDHIGGVNTLFYTLSNGGTVVVAQNRSPAAVCEAIERHAVELLPTSPTFLNLLLLSGELGVRDLSSLKLVTYGTEPMPESTLKRACEALPGARFLQTYGLTELGIMRSQSRDSTSLWVRIGGDEFEWKVVAGRLRIRAQSAMLGYLNAPSPFDAEGFFDTGDLVETDGEWVRFLGRTSDVINVGGNKVHPSEVESVLLQMDNVADAVVCGEAHAMMGQVVGAIVRLASPEPAELFKIRMRRFCADRLAPFKVPVKVHITDEPVHSARFKRMRRTEPAAAGALTPQEG
jgi:acyl-CoA synthetase (AMP-forming)/AMP-acid ligase II